MVTKLWSCSCSCVLFWLSIVPHFLLVCNAKTAVVKLPSNVTIPALFAFGDSVVDAGNNNFIATLVKSNFPPYGRDFYRGPTGRFSNGKVPTDLLAEALGIKELLPAFLDPDLQTEDLLTGVNFASGGAGYDHLTAVLVSVISLEDQLMLFKDYKKQLKTAVGDARANAIVRDGLFLVVVGSDDLANTYFTTPIRRAQYDIHSYTDFMIRSAHNFFLEIYKEGARRIGVGGVPPIGCLPSQRTLAGGRKRSCAKDHNKAAKLMNTKLLRLLKSLKSELPGVRFAYIDGYGILLDFIRNPHKAGFNVVDRGCCGTGFLEVAKTCNRFDVTCKNVSQYLFWDSYHPTEKAYKQMSDKFTQKFLDDMFSDASPVNRPFVLD